MKIFEYFRRKKQEKNLPFIAKVDLVKLQKERRENIQLDDVSILARADYTKRIPTIRLCYVGFEKFKRYGSDEIKIGETYSFTNPYRLPRNMTMDDSLKVVSYLTEKVERENGLSRDSEKCVIAVSKLLSQYGFEKVESRQGGYFHEVSDYRPFDRIKPTSSICREIDGVVDLITIGGDEKLFKWSDISDRNFKWFTRGIREDKISAIYDKIGLNLDELLSMAEIIKTGEQDNWKDNDNMASHIKKNIFDVSTK